MHGRWTGLSIGCALLAVAVLASLGLGARPVALGDVLGSYLAFDGSADQIVVRELRLPRTIVGVLVGAALGVAGVLMQGLSRNPVADPGLLGVSAGAALGVVVAITLFGASTAAAYVWVGVLGAAIASVVVFAVAGRTARSPITALVLAGAAVSATVGSLTASILAVDRQTLDQYRFWAVGSLQGRGLAVAADIAPLVLAGLVLALLSSRGLDALALGEDVARALGRSVGLVRIGVLVAIVLLTGAAVAAAGPLAFVGLVVPHLVRPLTGPRHSWQLLLSAVYAPVLVLVADVVGRLAVRPAELPLGIVLAVVGAPFLIWVVRRERRPRTVDVQTLSAVSP
jgi:iron complex transport system permease protein